MRARVLTAVIVVAAMASVPMAAVRAWASDLGGQNDYANAQASGGQLTVQAGVDPLDAAGGLGVGETGRIATRRRASRIRTSPTAAPTRRNHRRLRPSVSVARSRASGCSRSVQVREPWTRCRRCG